MGGVIVIGIVIILPIAGIIVISIRQGSLDYYTSGGVTVRGAMARPLGEIIITENTVFPRITPEVIIAENPMLTDSGRGGTAGGADGSTAVG